MDTSRASVKILVADDNDLVRNGLCSMLRSRSDWEVCGEAIDGPDAIAKAINLQPDVILLDVSMPGLSGFETAQRIHDQIPQAEILIVTEWDASSIAYISPQPCIRGYVLKSHLRSDLLHAVEAASQHRPLAAAMAAH